MNTAKNPEIKATIEAWIESAPRLGPTLLFSNKSTEAGNAPDLKAIATFPASIVENPPEI